MNTALRRELEQLLRETHALLACPDFDLSLWEAYGVRRAETFARLQDLALPTEEAEREAVAVLTRDMLAQDAVLIQKAQTRLSFLQAELTALATSRRALNGYTRLPSATVLQCEV
jgi:hypothetical protein